MAIKKVKYSKKFISMTKYEKEYHNRLNPYQSESKEDKKLYEKIISELAFFYDAENEKYHGFDGKQHYTFSCYSENIETKKDRLKNVKYDSIYEITKAGALENLENLSDLEKFLIKKSFKLSKQPLLGHLKAVID